jgi:hypothetical protein
MSRSSIGNDARHWRNRAEEARLLAADMKDEESRQAMLRIARDYERLALRAEERSKREAARRSPSRG